MEPRLLPEAQALVPGGVHIFRQRPGQPEQIVPAAAADPPISVGQGVPPVHHVPLGILMAAGVQDPLPGQARIHRQQIHRILELVPEAVGPAALV